MPELYPSNPPVPDYWGVSTAARLDDSVLAVDDSSPISGVRSIRLRAADATELTLLALCYRPLPIGKEREGEHFSGLKDVEERYRMRYVDLLANPEVRAVVVGMHAALPDSLASGHSMSDYPAGTQSGRQVYTDLLNFNKQTQKHVYILASHSHFYMSGIFDSDYWRANGGALPG